MGRSGRACAVVSKRAEKSATWCPKASTIAPPQAIGPCVSDRTVWVGRAHVDRSSATSVTRGDPRFPLGPDGPATVDLPIAPAV